MFRSTFRSSSGSSYSSLLKSLIKTVKDHMFGDAAAYRRVCVRDVQCREVRRLESMYLPTLHVTASPNM
jgi:hypothetical protein